MVQGSVQLGLSVADSFAAVARDLRRAANGGMRRELYASLQRAARPTLAAVRASAASLPSSGGRGRRRTRMVDTGEEVTNRVSGRTHRVRRRVTAGGLAPPESVADRVAAAKFTVRALAGRPGDARIRLQATARDGKRIDLRALNEGRLRHPLFGDRRYWYQQQVAPGWFDRPIEANLPAFERAISVGVDNIVRQLNGG